ncbi:glycoside hydrolase family 3 C-terminal domain-containing protein [Glycomyces sp. TRM65418]|uniref:glycoside hydrolase family 3 protein n=1 Tax=Glycomyces sp. TRM65418 TaxID=2867006 RepID=UPI001CE64F28|nr:glycoside hydrolase family 3 protein [Glycomyces sp. TRM65418]MCC3764030.1 glycoside hydrolase family 3 C-terminal domain-containing protein [Glycomyces sp. TRM65418]QZD53721.1 glycoside hydrolase family 3 C-terminal domain-containing protein [Glycomyces sp. TRM65418]
MSAPAYLDPNRPVAERVEAILALMTDEQKLACLNGVPETLLADGNTLPALRNQFNEVLHGSGHHADATLFPQAIGLGATWDTELMERIGEVVSHETRARDTDVYAGFGPVADIRSNPLAGRFEEGFGEDPLHVAAMTTAYAWGLRGRHPAYVRILPQMKHFLGYNHEWHRHRGSASMGVRALHEYQAVPYRKPVEAGAVHGAMTAYNLVNGVPSIISPIMDTLRTEWTDGRFFFLPDGWDGVNLNTTKGAVWDTWETPEGGDVPYPKALAAEAGRDIDKDETGVYAAGLMLLAGQSHFHDGSDLPFVADAAEAVRRGLFGLTMDHVDRAVRDWLDFLVRTGKLDGDACAYNRIEPDPHPQHRPEATGLALQAAREQLVLLKNDQAALPLPETARIAVLGPLAELNLRDYYSPLVPDERRVTPLQALRERLGAAQVTFHSGNDTVAWEADGKYVNVADSGALVARAETPGDTETFEVWDWAHDQYMFRHHATGTFVTANLLEENDEGATFANQAGASGGGTGPVLLAKDERMEDANAWFTFQNFHYHPAPGAETGKVELFGMNHVPSEPDGPFHVRLAEDRSLPLAKGPAEPLLTETLVEDGPAAAAAVAAEADWAVVFVGNHPLINARECFDRPGLDLAPRQADLVREVAAAKPGRTVVVVVAAYPLAIGDIAADPNVAAILYSSHAGQAAGTALAEALVGDYAPAGRLTSTWLADTASLPKPGPKAGAYRVNEVDMLEYDVISAGLTYRYSKAEPVFGFGHGLSYTTVEYSGLEVPAEADAGSPFTVAFDVRNAGERTSDEVALVFASATASAYGDRVPNAQLAGFTRVKDLAPGETRRVAIEVDPQDLFVWDVVRGERIVETGDYRIRLGVGGEGPEALVRLRGETVADLDLSETANVWEKATIAEGLTYWEVSKLHTVAREGGYHSTGSRRPGAYVGFTKAVLDGASGIHLRAATTGADWADLADPVVEVRAGAPDGRLLGEVAVPKTGDLQAFVDVEAPLTGAAGVQDLYLVFRGGGIFLDTVRLAR